MYNTKLLPMKLRMFQLLGEAETAMTADDLYEILEKEYGGEPQCNKKMIATYLVAMMAPGMIRENGIDYNKDGEIVIKYIMTDLGKKRMKYLPDNHNELAYK